MFEFESPTKWHTTTYLHKLKFAFFRCCLKVIQRTFNPINSVIIFIYIILGCLRTRMFTPPNFAVYNVVTFISGKVKKFFLFYASFWINTYRFFFGQLYKDYKCYYLPHKYRHLRKKLPSKLMFRGEFYYYINWCSLAS